MMRSVGGGDALHNVNNSTPFDNNLSVGVAPSSSSVSFLEEAYLDRINTTAVGVGHLKKLYVPPFRGPFFVSPDIFAWIVPSGITALLVFGTVYYTGSQQSTAGLISLFTLLGIAFVSSLLVGVTDPGVYPRLGHGERDPLESCTHLPICKICNMRRPRRAAHCYSCGVCVLEHDHHCGVIGGCVGSRSLRWFTLYLLSISSASAMGVYWITMSLLHPPANSDRPTATELMKQRARHQNQASLQTAAHIFLLIFIGNIVLLVGGMGLYYVYLMSTDTTRREAQGKAQKTNLDSYVHGIEGNMCTRLTFNTRSVLNRLYRSFFMVPQSMLVSRGVSTSEMKPLAKGREDPEPEGLFE
ncbi:zinc finger protein, putative [Bodo saltans]|uniref:Palmitoyltransferase n=1 Tax=Bodo saltans TaxID=75058 RepID=A0A0S4IT15_BODSA|nr:zinc finger protein, putative [Bodo saltans]|eukprot:CUF68066.1 zinc finger protein, putative [Bodo saltans]